MGLFGFGKKKAADGEPTSKPTHNVLLGGCAYHPSFCNDFGEPWRSLYVFSEDMKAAVNSLVAVHTPDARSWFVTQGRIEAEPTNNYDRHAILVKVDGKPIGYFHGEAQQGAHELLRVKRRLPLIIAVGLASWADGEKPSAYIFASKRGVDEWISERQRIDAEIEERRRYDAAHPTANVRRSGDFQPQLAQLWKSPGHSARAKAIVDQQPSGKYAGGPRITVYAENVGEIGVIEARYQEQDAAFFDAVLGGRIFGLVEAREGMDGYFARMELSGDED